MQMLFEVVTKMNGEHSPSFLRFSADGERSSLLLPLLAPKIIPLIIENIPYPKFPFGHKRCSKDGELSLSIQFLSLQKLL
jgi:hypothetical protein